MSEAERREIEKEALKYAEVIKQYDDSIPYGLKSAYIAGATAMAEKKNEEISRHKQVYQEMDEVNTKVIDTLKAELEAAQEEIERLKLEVVNHENLFDSMKKNEKRDAADYHELQKQLAHRDSKFIDLKAELERVKAVAEKIYKAFKEVRDNAAEAGEIMFGPKSIDYFDKILQEYEERDKVKTA